MDERNEPSEGQKAQEVTAAMLSERAQQIVTGLNDKRKQDTDMLAELKSTLYTQMDNVYCTVEQHMYNKYENHGKVFNQKVQELFACLERVATLETELAHFKQDLTTFCQEID